MNRLAVAASILAVTILSACSSESQPNIQMQVADGYIQYYNGSEWENLISLDDLRGPTGLQGPAGLNGQDGTDGADGLNGADGKDGADGKNGTDGKDGVDGKNGTDGKDGVDGKNGADGTDGIVSQCSHVYRQTSQVVTPIEYYEDGSYLARRTYTMVCDKCGLQIQMYSDFNVPAMPSPTPTPMPTLPPTSFPIPVQSATPEPTPVPTPTTTPTHSPVPDSSAEPAPEPEIPAKENP